MNRRDQREDGGESYLVMLMASSGLFLFTLLVTSFKFNLLLASFTSKHGFDLWAIRTLLQMPPSRVLGPPWPTLKAVKFPAGEILEGSDVDGLDTVEVI